MKVEKLSPQQWSVLSEKAHLIVFKENKPAYFDRIDYALICSDAGTVLGYLTAREMDHETVYWQFGGTFPSARGTILSFRVYDLFANWTKTAYKRVVTLIENDNIVMLKFAMKVGFRIQGIKNYHGNVLLEHVLEFL